MLKLQVIEAEELRRAVSGADSLPIEQSRAWEKLSAAEGNKCWRRFKWTENGKTRAVATFYQYEVRGIGFLWARRGPVWLKTPTPGDEAELRQTPKEYVRRYSPKTYFIRFHAWYSSPELHKAFQVIDYDRTVIIDGAEGNPDEALSLLPKNGQRLLRRAQKKVKEVGALVVEETGLSSSEFDEYYAILEQTALRDGFTPHEKAHYWRFLNELGPEHARLFAVRVDGELACWDIIGINGNNASIFYGATTDLARSVNAAAFLDFEVACLLAKEGAKGADLMGIHSPATPELYGVGRYKLQFASHYTDVPGVWDFPVKSVQYRAIDYALSMRNWLRTIRK